MFSCLIGSLSVVTNGIVFPHVQSNLVPGQCPFWSNPRWRFNSPPKIPPKVYFEILYKLWRKGSFNSTFSHKIGGILRAVGFSAAYWIAILTSMANIVVYRINSLYFRLSRHINEYVWSVPISAIGSDMHEPNFGRRGLTRGKAGRLVGSAV